MPKNVRSESTKFSVFFLPIALFPCHPGGAQVVGSVSIRLCFVSLSSLCQFRCGRSVRVPSLRTRRARAPRGGGFALLDGSPGFELPAHFPAAYSSVLTRAVVSVYVHETQGEFATRCQTHLRIIRRNLPAAYGARYGHITCDSNLL